MNILVPNLGSTSLKYQLLEFPSERVLSNGRLERVGQPNGDAADHREAIAKVLASPEPIDAVGFKAVHAGPRYRGTLLETFAYQVRKTIGAYAAAMGGVDVIAFTGGIGENATALRERCCRGLEFLGIRIDPARNSGTGDRVISVGGEVVQVVVLATNEELIVARETAALLSAEH